MNENWYIIIHILHQISNTVKPFLIMAKNANSRPRNKTLHVQGATGIHTHANFKGSQCTDKVKLLYIIILELLFYHHWVTLLPEYWPHLVCVQIPMADWL